MLCAGVQDPAIKQMAEQIASDPSFMEVTKQLQESFSGFMGPGGAPGAGGMPPGMPPQLAAMCGGGPPGAPGGGMPGGMPPGMAAMFGGGPPGGAPGGADFDPSK